uniref:Uncharacterized protein n=1 Tax=Arundo donax TaxID=35708 RepID=A0A0A9F6M5_ARUDO
MRRSGESTTSTLESESWAMESIETELFDNVRASIQRSLGKPDKVPGRPAASAKPPKATANVPRTAARKGVERMPQTKIRAPVSTSQGIAGGKKRPQASSKEPTAARVTLPGAAEAKPSSKPPRALPRVATMRSSTNTAITSGISDKRSSTGGVVNRPTVGKSPNTLASVRPGGITKSSSISKSGALTSAATSSFHGVSMDTKPDAKTKSATLGNKNRIAQRVPVRSSSRSDVCKTNPSRSSGNKIPARGHADRASPSISPSSSIDSMSSVISGTSTASTVGKLSHTSECSNPLSSLSPSLRKSNDHPPTTKLRPPIVTEGHSSGTEASGDNAKATADTTNQGKDFKPSGLRRPTPKIGYFDAEKSIDQNIGAQVQLQPIKFQCSLPATPKSQPSSTQIMNTASTTIGQQESKSTAAAHEESCASKSKAVPLKVAQMELEPFKVSEPEDDTSINRNSAHVQLEPMKIQCSPPATLKSQPSSTQTMKTPSSISGQQESKSIAAYQEESSASKSKAAPLEVAQLEVEPFKVAEPEACTGPVVAKLEAEDSIHQNISAQEVQVQPMTIQCSLPATPNSQPSPAQTMTSASSTFGHEEITASKMQGEHCKAVAEHELCVHQPSLTVAADASKENIPALHQNIQANGDPNSLAVGLLAQKLSSISLGKATANPAL